VLIFTLYLLEAYFRCITIIIYMLRAVNKTKHYLSANYGGITNIQVVTNNTLYFSL